MYSQMDWMIQQFLNSKAYNKYSNSRHLITSSSYNWFIFTFIWSPSSVLRFVSLLWLSTEFGREWSYFRAVYLTFSFTIWKCETIPQIYLWQLVGIIGFFKICLNLIIHLISFYLNNRWLFDKLQNMIHIENYVLWKDAKVQFLCFNHFMIEKSFQLYLFVYLYIFQLCLFLGSDCLNVFKAQSGPSPNWDHSFSRHRLAAVRWLMRKQLQHCNKSVIASRPAWQPLFFFKHKSIKLNKIS